MHNKPKPRLLEQVRLACRARQFSPRTEEAYLSWIRRYVLHNGKRHPAELGGEAITAFLTHMAAHHSVSISTQRQAYAALVFMYREVLHVDIDVPDAIARPVTPRRVPIVLSRAEVQSVLSELRGQQWLVASLLYGSGLRIMEAVHLRVKDLDIATHEIRVRHGKGGDDRITMMPHALMTDIRRQLAHVSRQHEKDVAAGAGWVDMPAAFARKSPQSARDLAWQWLFPAVRRHLDKPSGQIRRHHMHESELPPVGWTPS